MESHVDDTTCTVSTATIDMEPTGRLFGMAIMIISSVGISFGGLISRYIESADAWQINIYRSLSTAAVVAAVLLFRYRGRSAAQLTKIVTALAYPAITVLAANVVFIVDAMRGRHGASLRALAAPRTVKEIGVLATNDYG